MTRSTGPSAYSTTGSPARLGAFGRPAEQLDDGEGDQ
jgi:hypothetical protein